jgi:cholesterol transport system auxiliary component
VKTIRAILIIIFVSILTACSFSRPVKMPQQSLYAISNGHFSAGIKRSKTQDTLLVSFPAASSGYQTASMVYVQTPYQLNSFANNRWVASPATMIMPLIAQQIRDTAYFKAVVTPPFSGVTNYRLDTQLLALQQEFMRPTSFVRLKMQVTLVSNRTGRVVSSRRFQVMVSAPGNNPYSGVLAANKASNIMSQRVARFVVQSIR